MLSKVLQQQHLHLSSFSAASMEVNRRSRGRPPGSNNKPKAPLLLTRDDSEPPMSPYILQVSSGNDVVETIKRFCRRKGIGFCVLSGSGSVVNVTLRQPSPAAPGSTITFHGKSDLLSVSATFLPPPPRTFLFPLVSNFFTVSLAGPQGQIVAGPLISAGTVYVVAACSTTPPITGYPRRRKSREARRKGRNNRRRSLEAVESLDTWRREVATWVVLMLYGPPPPGLQGPTDQS